MIYINLQILLSCLLITFHVISRVERYKPEQESVIDTWETGSSKTLLIIMRATRDLEDLKIKGIRLHKLKGSWPIVIVL